MHLTLNRLYYRPNYIIGKLYINDVYFCDTLENSYFVIDPGDYQFKIARSRRFKKDLPCLIDVPHRSGIFIHAGNRASDTKGCILVGDNIRVGRVLYSNLRLTDLLCILNKNKDITSIQIY